MVSNIILGIILTTQQTYFWEVEDVQVIKTVDTEVRSGGGGFSTFSWTSQGNEVTIKDEANVELLENSNTCSLDREVAYEVYFKVRYIGDPPEDWDSVSSYVEIDEYSYSIGTGGSLNPNLPWNATYQSAVTGFILGCVLNQSIGNPSVSTSPAGSMVYSYQGAVSPNAPVNFDSFGMYATVATSSGVNHASQIVATFPRRWLNCTVANEHSTKFRLTHVNGQLVSPN